MSRIVVLTFEDNADADLFIKEHGDLYYYPEGSMGGVSNDQMPMYAGEAVGMFALPTVYCECQGTRGKRVKGWARGKKYGWWVHPPCGKPAKTTGEKLWRQVISQGVNLLEVARNELASVHDEGWGALGRDR